MASVPCAAVMTPLANQVEAVVKTHMTELDPHGMDAHTPGAKLDAGKPRPGLVLGDFARALAAVTDVGTYGAAKYTPHGWLSVPHGIERYTDAMCRHLLREATGELRDADTELLHAAHAAWNALARLDLMIRAAAEGGTASDHHIMGSHLAGVRAVPHMGGV